MGQIGLAHFGMRLQDEIGLVEGPNGLFTKRCVLLCSFIFDNKMEMGPDRLVNVVTHKTQGN